MANGGVFDGLRISHVSATSSTSPAAAFRASAACSGMPVVIDNTLAPDFTLEPTPGNS